MEQEPVVDALPREMAEQSQGSLRRLRAAGWIPGVLYGGAEATTAISIPETAFHGTLSASPKYVELSLLGQRSPALVHEIQRDPLTRRITHVDFYRVDVNQPAEVDVPIHLHGVEVAQRRRCIVQQQLRTVTIRVLPKDAPEYISVDVSALEPGQHITVGEIVLPAAVTRCGDAAEVVVAALAPARTILTDDQVDDDRQAAEAVDPSR